MQYLVEGLDHILVQTHCSRDFFSQVDSLLIYLSPSFTSVFKDCFPTISCPCFSLFNMLVSSDCNDIELIYVRKCQENFLKCHQTNHNVHMNRYVYLLKRFCRNLHHEISQTQNILIWNENGGCQ